MCCPSGWGCGAVDGVCRQPSGNYEEPGEIPIPIPRGARLATGDFDGDGFADVVTRVPVLGNNGGQEGSDGGGGGNPTGSSNPGRTTSLQVRFSNGNGGIASIFDFPSPDADPAVGRLTPNARDDLALVFRAQNPSLAVLRGESDRTFEAAMYTSPLPTDATTARMVMFDAITESINPVTHEPLERGDELVLLIDQIQGAETRLVVSNAMPGRGQDPVLGRFSGMSVSMLAGEIQTGQIAEGSASPCEELVFALRGAAAVRIFEPSVWNDAVQMDRLVWNWNDSTSQIKEPFHLVGLPPNIEIQDGVLLRDVNNDGHLDLLIGAAASATNPTAVDCAQSPSSPPLLYVAYGRGDGNFHSQPVMPPAPDPTDNLAAQVTGVSFSRFPLDGADLNGDGALDWITPCEVVLSPGPVPSGNLDLATYHVEPWRAGWSSVRALDLNGNGLVDIVAMAPDAPAIFFLNGLGNGEVNISTIPLSGLPGAMAVGDFNGDLLLDVACAEHGNVDADGQGSSAFDSLSVAFGVPFGTPQEPVTMGRIDPVQLMAVGNIMPDYADGMADLVLVAKSEDSGTLSAALLYGNVDGRLTSPFYFWRLQGIRDHPRAVAMGQFDSDPEGHLDLGVVTGGVVTTPKSGTSTLEQAMAWLLPSTGDAELDPARVVASEVPAEMMDTDGALQVAPLLVTLDTDGDGADELVVLGTRRRSNGNALEGTAAVADVGMDPALGWIFGASTTIDELHGAELATVLGEPGVPCMDVDQSGFASTNYAGQVQAGDVDGDGRKDVVALGVVAEQYEACGRVSAGRTVVSVFRNLGDGQLFAGQPHVLSSPEPIGSAGPTTFTLIQADADAAMEILLATSTELYLADFDPVGVALVNVRRLEHADGRALPGGFSAASGDFNGDGVDDIAVAGAEELALYLGRPLR
jgi:hypothetical protein